MPPMSASEHLLSRIRAHIPAGYWRVLSVYRVAHGGATSAAVRKPVCSLPMVVTGSLALGMDGGGAQPRWAAARTGNPWASAAALAASRRLDAGCSSCAPGCCPARRSPSGRVGSRPPGPDQGARPRAHAPGTQRPLPRSFARCRYLDRCRLLLSASAVLGAAKRLGAGLSLRPYFVARRQLLQRGPQRVELAAVEAWRCAPAPLTAPCACAMTPATLCTDPAPPDALTCRLTPSRPTAA